MLIEASWFDGVAVGAGLLLIALVVGILLNK